MRVRVTIEYDADWAEGIDQSEALQEEQKAWIEGDVDVFDVMQTGGKVTWEVIHDQ